MPEPGTVYPFSSFNFDVQIEVAGLDIKKSATASSPNATAWK